MLFLVTTEKDISLPSLAVLKRRLVPQEPESVTGHWFFMLEDGSLIGDSSDDPMNHFEAMTKAVGKPINFHAQEDNFVVKAFYAAYRAIRVSLDFNYRETSVHLLGQPTSAQRRSIAALAKRTGNRVVWDFGLFQEHGAGTIADFQRSLDKWAQIGPSSGVTFKE